MEQVKIGWAKKEVSIDAPVPLAGQLHFRRSRGVHDPLYATALAIDGGAGQDGVVMLSCDVIALGTGFIDSVKEKVAAADPTVPVDAIVINATHTHTGGSIVTAKVEAPDGAPILQPAEYRAFFIERAAQAVCEAWANRKAGGIGFGYSFAVVGHSRRPVYFVDKGENNPNTSNGHAVMYGDTCDPEFSHYEAGADHFVNVLITYDEKGAVTGFVINVPCPSQISGFGEMLSADYWNEVREGVAKEFGEGVFVLPQCAAAGDLAPRVLHYKPAHSRRMMLKFDRPYDRKKAGRPVDEESRRHWEICTMAARRDIAERILFAVKDVASWACRDIQTEVRVDHIFTTLRLTPRFITEEERAHCESVLKELKLEIPEGADEERVRFLTSRYRSAVRRNKRVVERYEEQDPDDRVSTRVHVFRIGEVAFCTNGFELYQDYQHRIQARSPFLQTFVVQLAGEENGSYLPTLRAQRNKGYGSSVYENRVGAEGGQQLVEETLRILNEMKA
ncbi:MAG: hypothetical protein II776_00800, partial [Clostridia bacterium]|nr:hypothetical protein [Clostridia bacterium]